MSFAEGTEVPIERSRAEVERLISRYGASSFASGFTPEQAVIMFEAHGRRVKLVLPIPPLESFARAKNRRRSPSEQRNAYDAEMRRLWRCLALVVKAKLEAVASKVVSFETEFLAHIVDPNTGRTIGEIAIPQIVEAYERGTHMPPLLGTGS